MWRWSTSVDVAEGFAENGALAPALLRLGLCFGDAALLDVADAFGVYDFFFVYFILLRFFFLRPRFFLGASSGSAAAALPPFL